MGLACGCEAGRHLVDTLEIIVLLRVQVHPWSETTGRALRDVSLRPGCTSQPRAVRRGLSEVTVVPVPGVCPALCPWQTVRTHVGSDTLILGDVGDDRVCLMVSSVGRLLTSVVLVKERGTICLL